MNLIGIVCVPSPAPSIITESLISILPLSYFGKSFTCGEHTPPIIGSLIIPPCTCPENTRSYPASSYVEKYTGLCAIRILYS